MKEDLLLKAFVAMMVFSLSHVLHFVRLHKAREAPCKAQARRQWEARSRPARTRLAR
jgi:hypothetical protein